MHTKLIFAGITLLAGMTCLFAMNDEPKPKLSPEKKNPGADGNSAYRLGSTHRKASHVDL